MDTLDPRELLALVDREIVDGPAICTSAYQTVPATPTEARRARIVHKNQLQAATAQLRPRLGDLGARTVLTPVERWFEDAWPRGARGLAWFAAPGFCRCLWLPLAVEEMVVVGDRFHTLPLLALVGRPSAGFAVLAFSQHRVRLFIGNDFGLQQLDADLPAGLDGAVARADPERTLQMHTTGPVRRGAQGAIFHGNGDDPTGDHELTSFVRAVDQAVCQALAARDASNVPLLLACVEQHVPIYRQTTRHPQVLSRPIRGNPDELDAADLHRRAIELLGPLEREESAAADARLRAAVAHGRAALALPEVLNAARQGRVDELFVDTSRHEWIAPDGERTDGHGAGRTVPGGVDLLDVAATEALRHGARIRRATADDLPGGVATAAVLRY